MDIKKEIQELRELRASAIAQLNYNKAINVLQFSDRKPCNQSLYFLTCGDAVKIGRSKDPKARMETLQTGAPGKCSLLAEIPNAGDREKDCHKRFQHLHLYGEWFRYNEEIDSFIKSIS